MYRSTKRAAAIPLVAVCLAGLLTGCEPDSSGNRGPNLPIIEDRDNSGVEMPSDIGRKKDAGGLAQPGQRCEKYGKGTRRKSKRGKTYECKEAIGGLRWRRVWRTGD